MRDARIAPSSPRVVVSNRSSALLARADIFRPSSTSAPLSKYYAALLRTHQSFIVPTQGKPPGGVVTQIYVGHSRDKLYWHAYPA